MSTRADELRAEAERQRRALAADLELVGDRVSPGRMADRKKAAVRQRVTSVRTTVMGTVPSTDEVGGVTDRVAQAASDATSTLGSVPERAARGNPLGAGLVAFGAGLLVATLLPQSATERRLASGVQSQADQVAAGVASAARQAADEVKPQAEEAVQAVTDSAKESVETVRDEAKTAARSVADEGKGQADAAKHDLGSP